MCLEYNHKNVLITATVRYMQNVAGGGDSDILKITKRHSHIYISLSTGGDLGKEGPSF